MTKRRRMVTAGILAMVTVTGGLVEAQNPATAPVLRARADSLLRQRNFDAAAGLYRQILERDSTQIGVFMGLGRATSGAGQIDEAIGWYRRALDAGTAPQNLIAYLLAQLYARRGAAYSQAHIRIDASRPIAEIVERILEWIGF